ncbi:hypothetical protein Nit79A3_2416 [Nitrosomonas sp. Is79A3]|uniref:hypothetical protein n=1 Tax=Nitrosomonas sp. (strain Is79A3) TaxID=261292 RepID=UPI000215CA31
MDNSEVRRLFPSVIAFADHCRAVFGDGVKLVYAKENGREIGKASVIDPERLVKASEMCIDSAAFCVDDKDKRRAK